MYLNEVVYNLSNSLVVRLINGMELPKFMSIGEHDKKYLKDLFKSTAPVEPEKKAPAWGCQSVKNWSNSMAGRSG